MKTTFCPECRTDSSYTVEHQRMKFTINDQEIEYYGDIAYCDNCGEEIFIGELSDSNLDALYDEYKARNGILPTEMIIKILKKYRIGKRPMSLLLGWGEQTISRYLVGKVPSKKYSDELMKLYNDPEYYLSLLEKNKNNLQSQLAYNKSRKAVEEILGIDSNESLRLDAIIKYVLSKSEDITHLTLQKALYYIQGFYYAFQKDFIIDEDCEAWAHGPVYRSVYHRYSGYSFDKNDEFPAISTNEFSGGFTDVEKDLIDNVVRYICCFSGRILEEFTHLEIPWILARHGLRAGEPSKEIINKEIIGDFFVSVKEKYGMTDPKDIGSYSLDMFNKINGQIVRKEGENMDRTANNDLTTTYYAHSKGENKEEWELLKDHLYLVAWKCEEFTNVFQCKGFGRIAGLLHDIGKYTREFQMRLEGQRIRVDHSSAGAIEAEEILNPAYTTLLQYVITGHHEGLLDFGTRDKNGTVAYRLEKEVCEYYAYQREIDAKGIDMVFPPRLLEDIEQSGKSVDYGLFFFIKMLFSCLVDADFLETEEFMQPEKSKARGMCPAIEELAGQFERFMDNLKSDAAKTSINENRDAILNACLNRAKEATGLFSLTVPTGGGKTLASMAFALNHAIKHNMDRIIYVIPYTSIIEQTAKIFKDIFGESNVLEHHSNFDFQKDFDYENDLRDDVEQKAFSIKLASENWDVPIVVTTNVQFFESIYASKTSKSRKLHNVANAVIILDEAQLLPTSRLHPSLECLCELADKYHSSIVLCTATQPAVDAYLREGFSPIEIVSKNDFDPTIFKRVKYDDVGKIDINDLVGLLKTKERVLCVVNSKKLAGKIFENLPSENRFHLSGNMCPQHRSEMLEKIKELLAAQKPVRVVTTQLIEAGVDIDFPTVFRQYAGIDSIIQAAGRCNREGRLNSGEAFIFDIVGEHLPKGYLSRTAAIGAETIRKYGEEIDSEESVKYYFDNLYALEDLDRNKVMSKIKKGFEAKCHFPFRSIAEEFKLIQNDTVPVIIPYNDEAREQIDRLAYAGNAAARKLQKYTVNVYGSSEKERASQTGDFQRLLNSGGIRVISDTYYVLNVDEFGEGSFYSLDVGIRFEGNDFVW